MSWHLFKKSLKIHMVVGNDLPKAKFGAYLNKSGFYVRMNVNCFKDLKRKRAI